MLTHTTRIGPAVLPASLALMFSLPTAAQSGGSRTALESAAANGSGVIAAQEPDPRPSPWTITTETDPLTDKTVFTAVVSSASDVGTYELTLTCDGANRTVSLSTYTPSKEERAIPFETSEPSRIDGGSAHTPTRGAVQRRPFHCRIDDEVLSTAHLEPAGNSNIGRVMTVSADAMVPPLAGSVDIFNRIPAKRLIITDVFPDEHVQFAFAALTGEQRNQMQAMCFTRESESAGLGERQKQRTSEVYRPGNGVILPRVLRQVHPNYTADALRAKVQGSVCVEAVVLPDGSVGQARVVRSLDPKFGLDEEALKAARQWRFAPGTRLGQPVAVLVTIEMTFSLWRKSNPTSP